MLLRRITLLRNRVRNGTVEGVFISYRGLAACVLVAAVVAVPVAGYLHQRSNAMRAQAERALSAEREKLLALGERHRAVSARLAAAEGALDAASVGKTKPDAALVARMREAFDSGDWRACVAACDGILSLAGIGPSVGSEAYLKRSLALVLLGDLPGAEATVAAALGAYGESEAFVHLAADILIAARRLPEAARMVEYACAKYPGPAAQFARGSLAWATGSAGEAARDYEEVISSGQPLLEKAAAGNLALLYAEGARDAAKARKYVSVLESLAPVGYRTKLVAGSVESALGDYANAEKLLLSAYKDDPKRCEVLFELGLLYERMGRGKLSAEYMAEARSAAPGGVVATDVLRNAWIFAVSMTPAASARVAAPFDLEKARELIAGGRAKEAAQLAATVSPDTGSPAEALLFAAALSSAAGRAIAAERLYIEVLERGTLDSGATRGLAATLLSRGLYERARYWAARGLESEKRDTVLLSVDAAAAFATGDYKAAIRSAEAYLAAGGRETTGLAHILAGSLKATGASDTSVTAQFGKAIALDGANAAALNDYAMYLAETGRAADAVPLAERLIAAAGRKGYSLDTAAFVNYRAGRLAEARRFADEAMAVEPGHPEVLFHAALVYRRLGLPDKGAEFFSEAMKAAGDNAALARHIRENYERG